MLLHPFFRTLVSQPEILAEHAAAYAALASSEAGWAAHRVKSQAMLFAAALACGALGVSLAGTAVMLLAVLPVSQMPAPWALALAPAVPMLVAAGLWWAQRREAVDWSFPSLREQMALDGALLRQISERQP
jgi:lysozyme family protein